MRTERLSGDAASLLTAQSNARCITCHRRIDNIVRRSAESETRVPILPEPDFCAFCGLALSARAIALEEEFARPAQRELTVNVDTRGVAAR